MSFINTNQDALSDGYLVVNVDYLFYKELAIYHPGLMLRMNNFSKKTKDTQTTNTGKIGYTMPHA